jgi:hypothetical protein
MLNFDSTAHADSEISLSLNRLIEEAARNVSDRRRDYLGASAVGHPCARKVQYDWQFAPNNELRLREIFDRGHYFEARARAHLRRAKFRFATRARLGFAALNGLFRGHADGILVSGPKILGGGFPCLWEHKCLNNKGWRAVNAKGLLEYEQYRAQISIYQAYLDVAEHPAVFTVTNADTCEKLHLLVPFDTELAQQQSDRALMIIEATQAGELLPRFTDNDSDWRCRMCPHHERCWS